MVSKSTAMLLQNRPIMIECAPLGKFARVVHDFVQRKPLPGWFGFWGVISTLPAMAVLYAIEQSLGPTGSAVVGIWSLVLLIPMLVILLVFLAAPTHVKLTGDGIRVCWKRTICFDGPLLKWQDMQEIKVVQPANTSRAQSRLLYFWGPKRRVSLKVDEVTELAMLPVIYQAILQYAPLVPRDSEVQSILGSDKANASYTELWLKALTAPPERTRLVPLTEGTALQDGEYIVHGRIGAGGQGVAYTASKRSGEQAGTVVLKEYILPVGVSHGVKVESLEKFQREAQILSQINHPQIVKLIDFFFEDHRGYMVLEYVQGTNLSGLVRLKGPLDENTVAGLLVQMAEILSYLHQQDPPVVHRDFTPDNLILTDSGVLKLIDFNVAQQKRTSATATVVGKHAYIAPDQFRGHATPQSDIYSMGATAFFLLTGVEPKPISVSHPRDRRGDLSPTIDEIVSRSTAIEPENRYHNAREITAAVRSMPSQSPQKAESTSSTND